MTEKFSALDNEKTIAILGDGWWPQKVTQEGDKVSKTFCVMHGKKVMGAQMLEVSIKSRNSALYWNGCRDSGQITKASNK